jgi:hypothetical protein
VLHAKLERATLTERRLCVAKVRRIDDPLGSEDNIAVHEIELAADKGPRQCKQGAPVYTRQAAPPFPGSSPAIRKQWGLRSDQSR